MGTKEDALIRNYINSISPKLETAETIRNEAWGPDTYTEQQLRVDGRPTRNNETIAGVITDLTNIVTGFREISNPDPYQRRLAQEAEKILDNYLKNLQTPGVSGESSDLVIDAVADARARLSGLTPPRETTSERLENAQNVVFAKQCFLSYNVDVFADFHRKLLSNSVSASSNFYDFNTSRNEIQTSGYYDKTNNRQVIYLAEEEKTNVFNKLTAKKFANKITDLKTIEASQLHPHLRIFKKYREPTESYSIEFEFDASSKRTADNTGSQTVEDIIGRTNTRFVRGRETGVKSFEWQFIGSDPFTATKEVTAKLIISTQDFSNLVETRTGPKVGDLSRTGSAGPDEPGQYRYMDLILQPDCRDPDIREKNYATFRPECYEIIVEVGHSAQNLTMFGSGSFDDDPQFREAIKCSREVLILAPEKHEFSYSNEGNIELTINLRGRMEMLLRDKSMNVLLPYGGNANSEINVKLEADNDGTLEFNQLFGAQYASQLGSNPENIQLSLEVVENALAKAKGATTKNEKQIESLVNSIANTYAINKQNFYSHVLSKMSNNKSIFYYQMSDTEINQYANYYLNYDLVGFPQKVSSPNLAAGSAGAIELNSNTATALDKAVQNIKENRLTEVGRAAARKVNYFFLGDMIAVMLDNLLGIDEYSNYVTRITSQTVGAAAGQGRAFIPGTTLGGTTVQATNSSAVPATVRATLANFHLILGNLHIRTKNDPANTETINIAHIPISVDTYNTFMIEKVLGTDAQNYPLFDFLDDFLKFAVADLYGSKCFGGLLENNVRVQGLFINSNRNIDNSWTNGDSIRLYDKNSSGSPAYKEVKLSLMDENSSLVDSCQSNPTQTKEYFIIGLSSLDEQELEGKRDEDNRNGILHLHFGRDRGLVKTIKFNKTNQEFLPEAQFASEGGLLLNQLANAYDVTIEMIGNNLFRIGQMVYIDAEILGTGPSWADTGPPGPSVNGSQGTRQRSWSNIMGLGGYHLVTEVANSITSDGSFNTTIKARYQSGGKREDF